MVWSMSVFYKLGRFIRKHPVEIYRPYAGGVASRLATAIYVAMVTPILYDTSYSPIDSNLKCESYRLYG